MKDKNLLLIISFLMFSPLVFKGQNVTKNAIQPELDSGTIENQLNYIITKSSTYKEFQLIRKSSILKVKSHILDSLEVSQKELRSVKSDETELNAVIKKLKDEKITLKKELDLVNQDKNSFLFLGVNINKSSYNTIVWVLIIVLAISLTFFLFQFKKSYSVIKKAKNELSKAEEELEKTKKKALKKEQEIMRKLQDEINKNNLG